MGWKVRGLRTKPHDVGAVYIDAMETERRERSVRLYCLVQDVGDATAVDSIFSSFPQLRTVEISLRLDFYLRYYLSSSAVFEARRIENQPVEEVLEKETHTRNARVNPATVSTFCHLATVSFLRLLSSRPARKLFFWLVFLFTYEEGM